MSPVSPISTVEVYTINRPSFLAASTTFAQAMSSWLKEGAVVRPGMAAAGCGAGVDVTGAGLGVQATRAIMRDNVTRNDNLLNMSILLYLDSGKYF